MSRPKISDAAIIRSAASIIAKRLLDQGCIEADDLDETVEQLAEHGRPHFDGYELAKKLESHEYWSCDFEIAEILNEFGHVCHTEHDKAEKEWAKSAPMEPPLPIGARVALSRGEEGTIDRIYEYGPNKYAVKVDGDPRSEAPHHSRRIINFEDATALLLPFAMLAAFGAATMLGSGHAEAAEKIASCSLTDYEFAIDLNWFLGATALAAFLVALWAIYEAARTAKIRAVFDPYPDPDREPRKFRSF